MPKLTSILIAALIVLAVIWAYNRFSETNISQLGVPKEK